MCKKLMFLFFIVLLPAAVNSAAATTYTWTNDYLWSVLWDDALNWDPPGVPGASDEAFINTPPERGPAVDCDITVGDIHGPRWDSDSNQVMDMVGGTIVVSGEWAWCDSGSGTGTINIGGSVDITINECFGGIYSGTGILNISDSPTITSNDEWRMVDGNSAVGIFNISGNPNITIHERVRLADDGLAVLNISGDPNIIIDGDLTAGYNSGGTLEAYISGGSLNVGGSFQIGNDGSGLIDISGGTVNCYSLELQIRPDDATGTLNISGGNVYVGESVLICDGSGTATMNMSGGDVYVEGSVRICDGSGTATMNMSGGDVNTGELWLPGGDGTGILNMTGGVLAVRGAILAPRDSGGTSIINLDGGLIMCGSFTPAGPYSMNIEEGVLVIDGDVRSVVYADIAAGYITGYGGCSGRGDVMLDFDNVNPGKTTVWALPVLQRAWNPWPGCDAEYIPREVLLSWSAGDGAMGHHVFFGTSFDDVNSGDFSVFKGSQTGTIYNVGTLSFGVTYYWRIDEVGQSTYTPGLVWSFTLGDIIVVDDMESYTPGRTSPNAISDVWIDGVTNSTGSTVYLGIASVDPVYAGEQSMLYVYDNTSYSGQGYYSELERQYTDPCDWTARGVKALTLCFYGYPDNDANDTERMYVALEDSSSNITVVPYDGDANDVKIAEWQEWNLDLQDFNDGGVDLRNIKKVYIGFGDRDNQVVTGGLGVVYFDDIILYPTRCVPKYGPVGDVSGDCVVDLKDLDVMADEWLDSGEVTADVYPDGKVDFKDYAVLINNWLEFKLWP